MPQRPERGRSRLRVEDGRFLTGKGSYVDDLNEPSALHAHVLRSPFGHARIRAIDISAASAMPGVVGVFTARALREEGLGHLSCAVKVATLAPLIVPPRPALVPLTVAAPWVADLRGITLPDVGVRILDDGKVLATRRWSLLLAHFGLSGPVVLDVSRVVSGHGDPQRLLAEIDLLPELRDDAVSEWLRAEANAAGKRQLACILATKLPRRLSDTLLALVDLPVDRLTAGLRKEERARLVQVVKHLSIPLTGTLGFKKAEVTAGGVALEEVDSRTMQSKKVVGLYPAGEILDLDGPIGGYNFQAAWSTGWLAGSSA